MHWHDQRAHQSMEGLEGENLPWAMGNDRADMLATRGYSTHDRAQELRDFAMFWAA